MLEVVTFNFIISNSYNKVYKVYMVHRNGLCRITYTYKNIKTSLLYLLIVPITILFGKYAIKLLESLFAQDTYRYNINILE